MGLVAGGTGMTNVDSGLSLVTVYLVNRAFDSSVSSINQSVSGRQIHDSEAIEGARITCADILRLPIGL